MVIASRAAVTRYIVGEEVYGWLLHDSQQSKQHAHPRWAAFRLTGLPRWVQHDFGRPVTPLRLRVWGVGLRSGGVGRPRAAARWQQPGGVGLGPGRRPGELDQRPEAVYRALVVFVLESGGPHGVSGGP
jgi:hypothetical protein